MGTGQRLPRDAARAPWHAAPPPVRWDVSSAAPARTRARRQTINLLNTGELYGEGYTIFDLKLAKNVRFANKRLNIGVDIYNLFNNDAIRIVPGQLRRRGQPDDRRWSSSGGRRLGLLSPRFARLSLQFDF